MSRHRDVRNMDYSEDYDGYDDIYGHSVDEDYYISPSHRQFLYNRENAGQSRSGDVYPMEQDIQEEDETEEELKLSEMDRAKLESCLQQVKTVLSPIDMPRQEIVKIIIDNKFEADKILNSVLNTQRTKRLERRDKGDTVLVNHSLNGLKKHPIVTNLKLINKLPPTLENIEAQSNSDSFASNLVIKNTQPAALLTNSASLYDFIKKNNSEDTSSDTVDSSLGTSAKTPIFYNKAMNGGSVSFLSKIRGGCESHSVPLETSADLEAPSCISFLNLNGDVDADKEIFKSHRQFLSRRKIIQNEESNLDSPPSSSREVSFISRIRKPNLDLNSEGSSTETESLERSPQLLFASRIKNLSESENCKPEIDFSKKFRNDLNLSSASREKDGRNVKVNTFLSRISKDNPLNSLKQSKSELFFPTLKSADLSENLSRLKLMEVHSLPSFKENADNRNFDIDLTTALRKSNSQTHKLKVGSSEDKFEIPFIACDDNRKKRILKCALDSRHLASQKVVYENKRPSQFGKVLSLRYGIPKFKKCKKKKIKLGTNLVRFDFSTPSPDDQISKYLKRDL